jgi:hypothetical protein
LQRAPRAKIVGPGNSISCDPVRERGDKGFWGALCATTDEFFITDVHEEDVFPNNDFFLDIDDLFNNMSLTNDNINNSSTSALASTPYVFLIIAFLLQFLGLVIDLDMLDMFCSYRSLVNMVSLISMFLAIFCLQFSWIKYYSKLLKFPTASTAKIPLLPHLFCRMAQQRSSAGEERHRSSAGDVALLRRGTT